MYEGSVPVCGGSSYDGVGREVGAGPYEVMFAGCCCWVAMILIVVVVAIRADYNEI